MAKRRKFFYLFLLSGLFHLPAVVQAQTIFLFDDFVNSKVVFRNRSVTPVQANYDAKNKRILYKQGEEVLELTNVAMIDTVFFGQRKFVPASKGFHEVVKLENGVVLIDWLLKDVNIGSRGALGSVTQSNVRTLQTHDFDIASSEMRSSYTQESGNLEVFRRKNDNSYYLNVKGKPVKVKSVKQLKKLYPDHENEINAYAKQIEMDMKDVQKVLVLLNYCLGL